MRIAYDYAFVEAHRLGELKPGMLPDVFNTWPLIWLLFQNCPNQANDGLAEEFRD